MAKKETLTDDGKLEEVDMEEAKDDNKKLGMPAVDGEAVSYTHLTLPTICSV